MKLIQSYAKGFDVFLIGKTDGSRKTVLCALMSALLTGFTFLICNKKSSLPLQHHLTLQYYINHPAQHVSYEREEKCSKFQVLFVQQNLLHGTHYCGTLSGRLLYAAGCLSVQRQKRLESSNHNFGQLQVKAGDFSGINLMRALTEMIA